MVEMIPDTETKIIEAAKEEFVENGMAGARMQSIADRAGINKSLLHYYFRTKEKLFDFVFTSLFKQIVPRIEGILNSDKSIFEKIEDFVNHYIDLILKHPFLPLFIINELNKNPDRLIRLVKATGIKPVVFVKQVEEAIKDGNIRPISAHQLIVNVIALSIFPIVAKPMVQTLIFNGDKNEYDAFIQERKTEVPKFIINAIKL